MSVLPISIKVSCPYCGAQIWVKLDRFEWRQKPVLVLCESDEAKACEKWFVARIDVDVTVHTQLLSGE